MGTPQAPTVLSEFDLLERGYLPKELPPIFDSAQFASELKSNLSVMPSTFTSSTLRGRPALHNFARVGNLRRRLGIPNPVLHYNLCKVIADNWSTFDGQIRGSALSQSYPVQGTGSDRALRPFSPDLIPLRASHRATARFLLKTDVTRFYHSIYTHSIPWALHTKPVAKKNRSLNLVGNQLDFWVRNGQDGQTLGLPIGPDTSLVMAELILSAVDSQLLQRVPSLRGFRFMDDYELTFASRSNAEFGLGHLQEAMGNYELALSGEKTVLTDLPAEIDQNWVAELRDFEIRETVQGQSTDLVRFFDSAYELSKSHPSKNVLSYGVGRLKSLQLHADNWQLFQDLLFQAILAEPGTVAPVLAQLHQYQQSGWTVDLAKLVEVVNIQVRYQAPIGHGSERLGLSGQQLFLISQSPNRRLRPSRV